ncbi:MAG TPA: hypothetical protein VHS28_06790, partial [Chloroflexota bacterium]|nr:hypothetical protein [Chloroflexota bacterium]
MERNLDLLRGTYWWKRRPHDASVRFRNHIGPAMAVKHDVFTSGETEFDVAATEPRFLEMQSPTRGVLNHAWSVLGFDEQCRAAVWDSYSHGFGVTEVGWRFVGDPGDSVPEKDDPFIERFDPRSLIVDPQCTTYRLSDARYVFR